MPSGQVSSSRSMTLPEIYSFRHIYLKCFFWHMYLKCSFLNMYLKCSFQKYVPSNTCISNVSSGNFETFQHVCYLLDFLNLPSGTNQKALCKPQFQNKLKSLMKTFQNKLKATRLSFHILYKDFLKILLFFEIKNPP